MNPEDVQIATFTEKLSQRIAIKAGVEWADQRGELTPAVFARVAVTGLTGLAGLASIIIAIGALS